MTITRKPFQGVSNIIRFNWHFFVVSLAIIIIMVVIGLSLSSPESLFLYASAALIASAITMSLFASYYVYDHSNLYDLNWITGIGNMKILNLSAGFDETTQILKRNFPDAEIVACDFYNPVKHTEISIKRARKAYPPAPDLINVNTTCLPFDDNTLDKTIAIFAAHEIRSSPERILFFQELRRVTKPEGEIIVTEHLRDAANFLAYTIGFLHFFSERNWRHVFAQAGLKISSQRSNTIFVTTFTLKNGATS